MAVEFPVLRIIRKPAVLSGQSNGDLDPAILISTPGQQGGPTVRLVEPAARAWRVLCSAALQAGHTLKASGPADSYRPFSVQKRIFLERYTTDVLPGRPSKFFEGKRFFQKPGTAEAAVPGTSNHGEGLAVDVGVELDGDLGTESIDDRTVEWLVVNGPTFGWAHGVSGEPWHIHYRPGDEIPAAVLEFEQRSGEEDDMTPAIVVDHNGQVWVFRVNPRTKECEASFDGGGFFSLGGSFSSGVDAVADGDMVRIVGRGSDGRTIFSRIIFPDTSGPGDSEWFPVTDPRARRGRVPS